MNGSGLFYNHLAESSSNLDVLRIPEKQYLETPFYCVLRLPKTLQNTAIGRLG